MVPSHRLIIHLLLKHPRPCPGDPSPPADVPAPAPPQEIVPTFLEKLSDDELKKEAKNEAKNDALSSIVKLLKGLAGRAPGQEDTVKSLEMFRLKMILR